MRRPLVFALFVVLAAPFAHASDRVIRDVRYGSRSLQQFDVYAPQNARNAPVIMMVHGGSWRLGDKSSRRVYENKVAHWLPEGFIFISVNYRLDVSALDEADDISRALDVARKRAAEWGGDPSKFVLMGHSAGAHLVALVSQTTTAPLAGTIVLDTEAFDVVQLMTERHASSYDDVFGRDRAKWIAASPYHAATKKTAPVLVVCSSRGPTCPPALTFVNKLTKLGTRATLLRQYRAHEQINEDLGKSSSYTKAVDAFLASLSLNPRGSLLPPRGRRWREAPDEGAASVNACTYSRCSALTRLRHPLPRRGRGTNARRYTASGATSPIAGFVILLSARCTTNATPNPTNQA